MHVAYSWIRDDTPNDFYIQGLPILELPDGVSVVGFTNLLLDPSYDHVCHIYSCRVFTSIIGENVLRSTTIVSPRELSLQSTEDLLLCIAVLLRLLYGHSHACSNETQLVTQISFCRMQWAHVTLSQLLTPIRQ